MIATEVTLLAAATSMNLSQTEKINCPLCQESGSRLRYRVRNWSIVACNHCDFVYVNPRLQRTELLKLYSENYFDNKEIGYYHYTEDKRLRKANFEKWVRDSLPFLETSVNTKALDVGCAAGYCLDVFRQLNWTSYGIELDKLLAAGLRSAGHFVFDEPLITLNTSEKFGFISLFDVIEHLTDLPANMAVLHQLLDDDGIVVLVTPNYNSWQRKLFKKKWFQFKPIEHINYFTLASLTKLAEGAGFKVVHTKASGQFCDVHFLENRLKKYGFGAALAPLHFFTRILGLRNRYFYTDTASLYVVLQKKFAG